MNNT